MDMIDVTNTIQKNEATLEDIKRNDAAVIAQYIIDCCTNSTKTEDNIKKILEHVDAGMKTDILVKVIAMLAKQFPATSKQPKSSGRTTPSWLR